MNRVICWLHTLKETFVDNPLGLMNFGAYTSGHKYVEVYDNPDISILRCKRCGHIEVGFYELSEEGK